MMPSLTYYFVGMPPAKMPVGFHTMGHREQIVSASLLRMFHRIGLIPQLDGARMCQTLLIE